MDSSMARPSDQDEAQSSEQAYEASLKGQLDSLQRIRSVVAGLNSSLDRAKTNLDTVNATVDHSSALLNSWTRILSRSEHNQRLILNPAWTGASADIADAESDVRNRQREKHRRELEEQARREEMERKRVEEEQRRSAATPSGATRGRGRGYAASRAARGGSASSTQSQASARGVPSTGRAAIARYGRVRQSRGMASARSRGLS